MATHGDKQKGSNDCTEQTLSSQMQFQDDLEVLDASMAVMKEKITLCDMVFKDLLAIQRIVEEKGLCDGSFHEQSN